MRVKPQFPCLSRRVDWKKRTPFHRAAHGWERERKWGGQRDCVILWPRHTQFQNLAHSSRTELASLANRTYIKKNISEKCISVKTHYLCFRFQLHLYFPHHNQLRVALEGLNGFNTRPWGVPLNMYFSSMCHLTASPYQPILGKFLVFLCHTHPASPCDTFVIPTANYRARGHVRSAEESFSPESPKSTNKRQLSWENKLPYPLYRTNLNKVLSSQ